MSSNSDSRLSLETLKRLNDPAPPETHPTETEWDDLLAILSALYRMTAVEHDRGGRKTTDPIFYWMNEQLTALTEEVEEIHTALKQDGEKKERRFSLPGIPRPYLPDLDGPEWFFLLSALAALGLILSALVVPWSSLTPLFQ